MANGDRKDKGRGASRDVDDLKARLGLKVPRREPIPPAAPPPSAQPEAEGFAVDATTVTPVEESGRGTAPIPAYSPSEPTRAPRYEPPAWVDEPAPPPASFWKRHGRTVILAAVVAVAGILVGFVFGKGSSRSAQLARVKEDAAKIGAAVKSVFAKVEEVAAAISPAYAAARSKGGGARVEAILRPTVDWAGLDVIEKFTLPKELESVFDTDFFKLLGGSRIKLFSGFLVDFQRLAQGAKEQAERTKSARAQLEADAKAGAGGPKAYGVITQGLPALSRGEVVILRARRSVKTGKEEAIVVDVARPSAPGQPIAVPESAIVVLNAPGLIKTGSALLEEYNRRMRELAAVAQRLLEAREQVLALVDKVAAAKG